MRKPRSTVLCILDGIGLNPRNDGNAVALARKPNFDSLWEKVPSTTLTTFGERVGLPAGQMGNSEVGHLNIGAGRVVEQWLLRISRALSGNGLVESSTYRTFLEHAKSSPTIHLVGLYSDGGVHSHLDHLKALVRQLRKTTSRPIRLHLITDGRDTGPTRGESYILDLEDALQHLGDTAIASVIGRFFAMDRDNRWERTEKAYRLFVHQTGTSVTKASTWMARSYADGITDEFIEPAIVTPTAVHPDDSWIFWNFREDRMRQIVRALCIADCPTLSRTAPPAKREHVLCFTEYDHEFNLPFLFPQIEIKNHLGSVVAQHGLSQLRCAETEKYPHVTYFLNGGIEEPLPGEERRLLPSPRDVKTYDLKPEMSAHAVTEVVCTAIEQGTFALIVVNLANGDMVGHTGNVQAAIQAVETVDTCLGKINDAVLRNAGSLVVIADHGNAEQMINYEDGSPHTAHTTHPVPMMVIGSDAHTLRSGGALCDVAPTILQLMQLPKPAEMTGESLLVSTRSV